MPHHPCLRAVRGTVFFARLSARARARVSPGIGRALRRRPALRPSPAPASMARWVGATSWDVLAGALACGRHAATANILSCSSGIPFHLSPVHFP